MQIYSSYRSAPHIYRPPLTDLLLLQMYPSYRSAPHIDLPLIQIYSLQIYSSFRCPPLVDLLLLQMSPSCRSTPHINLFLLQIYSSDRCTPHIQHLMIIKFVESIIQIMKREAVENTTQDPITAVQRTVKLHKLFNKIFTLTKNDHNYCTPPPLPFPYIVCVCRGGGLGESERVCE